MTELYIIQAVVIVTLRGSRSIASEENPPNPNSNPNPNPHPNPNGGGTFSRGQLPGHETEALADFVET